MTIEENESNDTVLMMAEIKIVIPRHAPSIENAREMLNDFSGAAGKLATEASIWLAYLEAKNVSQNGLDFYDGVALAQATSGLLQAIQALQGRLDWEHDTREGIIAEASSEGVNMRKFMESFNADEGKVKN
jgi:hypothetical protein